MLISFEGRIAHSESQQALGPVEVNCKTCSMLGIESFAEHLAEIPITALSQLAAPISGSLIRKLFVLDCAEL
jgi:hypothetical protein